MDNVIEFCKQGSIPLSFPLGKESNGGSKLENNGVNWNKDFIICRTQPHPSKEVWIAHIFEIWVGSSPNSYRKANQSGGPIFTEFTKF